MSNTTPREQGGDHVQTADVSTLQTSQEDQAKGYLESLTDDDFIGELQSALEHAKRLTKKEWSVTVTADNVEIESRDGENKRISLPRPKSLDN
ncbi:hypothetical protein FIV42_02370 [Persicimonas caeni]|uniref:Amphi-Trp domain-containing protein n=1 Tax=Persicimonas caeni TaxID=2292766 RepID=A0A4Y6PMW7_PERCE|nr:hypothetical protein [Persicimonas caeni]QDG49624.1 hypothetical protein FIV42_02370 [Persicimonas caeni]QED30845.1 hypothetical protein FRD00_02365 [Persicimonas caeni]